MRKAELLNDLEFDGYLIAKAGEIGTVTAYLPEDKIFAIFFGLGKWVRFEEEESEFANRIKWIE